MAETPKVEVYSSKVRVRFYVPEARKDQKIALSTDQLRHLKVLRLHPGEEIAIFDGKGHEFTLPYSEKVSGRFLLENESSPLREPKTAITLAFVVPKGGRADVLVEKVSELGVSKLVPIVCGRSIVHPHEGKLERWRKIAIEACCQSERNIVPMISEPIPFAQLLENIKEYNQSFLCHGTGLPLGNEYTEVQSTLLIIGPEGDFTPVELVAAKEAGCTFVSLAPSTLRVETAAIVAVAQVVGMSEKSNEKIKLTTTRQNQ